MTRYYVTVKLRCGREEVQRTSGVFFYSKSNVRAREGECHRACTWRQWGVGCATCSGWVIEDMRKARPMRRGRRPLHTKEA